VQGKCRGEKIENDPLIKAGKGQGNRGFSFHPNNRKSKAPRIAKWEGGSWLTGRGGASVAGIIRSREPQSGLLPDA